MKVAFVVWMKTWTLSREGAEVAARLGVAPTRRMAIRESPAATPSALIRFIFVFLELDISIRCCTNGQEGS